ncbi:MAG: glycoside hydrolase family 28 protein [Phycisphaerae bacterium]
MRKSLPMLLLAYLATPALAATTLSITDTGALPDGKTLNTATIQKAIDQVATTGGGTVNIPAGTFLTGALFLKPGVNLHLDKGAILKGATDLSQFPKTQTRIEGHFQEWIPAMINADHCDHLQISGEGDATLDGSGEPFWTEFWTRYHADNKTKNLDVDRPRLIYIANSSDIHVSHLHLLNSAFWNLHLYNCRNAVIDGLDVKAGESAPSTDGTDIDSSQNIEIKNCTYHVNDDDIAIKGSKGPLALDDKLSPPVEHIHIHDCTFTYGQGVVTVGSEATIVRDIEVDHCTVAGPNLKGVPLCRLKLRPDTPQDYENLNFHDITGDGEATLIAIKPWTQYFDLQGHAPPTRTVKNVTLSSITGRFRSIGTIQANPGDTVENITFQNIDIQADPRALITDVKNLKVENVKLNGQPWTPPGANQ